MDLTPPGKLRCPKCATIMERIRPGSMTLEVDHCGRCGAMWFDPYELEAVLKAKGAVVHDVDFGKAKHHYEYKVHGSDVLECPRDHQVLLRMPDPRQPHVVIDLCRSCGGILLDAGELKDLSEFTLSERLKAFLRR